MASSIFLSVASDELAALRAEYEAGNLNKLEYNSKIWSTHKYLFAYSQFLRGTNVEGIEIDQDGVVFRLREPQIRLRCTEHDQRHVAITNLNFRQYESKEISAVMRLAKACSIVFDIGANTGLYSIALGRRFPDSKVIAFEPIPSTYRELERNVALNQLTNVVAHNIGLSDRTCDEPFHFDKTVAGAASAAALGPEFGPTEIITCRVESMDDFIDRTGAAPDFIKCDVEGGELRAFRGAVRMFKRFTPMIFTEMLRKWSARFGYHPNEIIAFFQDRGYECYVLKGGMLQRFREMNDDTVETNFFFLHTRRHLEMVRFLGLLS